LWATAGNVVSDTESAKYNVKEMNLTGNMSKEEMKARQMSWRSQGQGEMMNAEENDKIRPMEIKVY